MTATMKSTLKIGILLLVAGSALAFSAPRLVHPTPTVGGRVIVTTNKASPLFLASSAMQASQHPDNDEHPVTKVKQGVKALRVTMRATTGFSLTALRATTRAATGVSLTAIYVSIVAFTSGWVRSSMTLVLSIFPTWVSL